MTSARRLPLRFALVGIVAFVAATTACGSTGRAMRPPVEDPNRPVATRPPDPTTTLMAPGTGLALPGGAEFGQALPQPTMPDGSPGPAVAVTTPAWEPRQLLPEAFGCGSAVAPAIQWGEIPVDTAEVVVLATDLDTGQVLWLVTGIPADATILSPTTPPPGALTRQNSLANTGWDGPCPTDAAHTVSFEVLALPEPSALVGATPIDQRDELYRQAWAAGSLVVGVEPSEGWSTTSGPPD